MCQQHENNKKKQKNKKKIFAIIRHRLYLTAPFLRCLFTHKRFLLKETYTDWFGDLLALNYKREDLIFSRFINHATKLWQQDNFNIVHLIMSLCTNTIHHVWRINRRFFFTPPTNAPNLQTFGVGLKSVQYLSMCLKEWKFKN